MFSEHETGGEGTETYSVDHLSRLAEAQGDRVDHPRRETDMIDEPLTGALVQYLEILTGRSFDQYIQEQGGRAAVIAELETVLADFPEGQTLGAEMALEVLRHESHEHVMRTLGLTIAEKESTAGELDFNKSEFANAVGNTATLLMANRGARLRAILAQRLEKSAEA
jgi:hypothetical protein